MSGLKEIRKYYLEKEGRLEELQNINNNPMQQLADQYSGAMKVIIMLIYVAAIAALVAESTIMPMSIQTVLSPTERASHLAMDSFLTPVSEIFAFLEDAMIIKVGYAMVCNRYQELNLLLHISVIAGFVSGLLAFILMLAIALNDASAEPFLNPSAASNQALIDAGCILIPTTKEMLGSARIYWLLSAAAWIPNFMTKGIMGLLIGTGQFFVYFMPLIVASVVPLSVWFGLLALRGTQDTTVKLLNPLSILGLAYGSSDWILAILLFSYIACSSNLRQKYKLRCLLCRGKSDKADEEEANPGESFTSIIKEVVFEGLELMVVDLAIQLSLTVTIYVAAAQKFDLAYKLSSTQSAYWIFGPQYMVGTMLFLKMIGAQLVARKQYQQFVGLLVFATVLTLCLTVTAILGAYFKRVGVSYTYGESACIFGSNVTCAPLYEAIFGTQDSLSTVFEAFGPTVGLQMIFLLLRSALAMCHDFKFMAKSASAALILIYLPSIITIRLVPFAYTAVAYYVVMYLPHFFLILVFGWRLWWNLKALLAGDPGPWVHAQRIQENLEIVKTEPDIAELFLPYGNDEQ
jgi:hypothetical protein